MEKTKEQLLKEIDILIGYLKWKMMESELANP